eukprot:1360375-Pyramimonas_sp.AAC.1
MLITELSGVLLVHLIGLKDKVKLRTAVLATLKHGKNEWNNIADDNADATIDMLPDWLRPKCSAALQC